MRQLLFSLIVLPFSLTAAVPSSQAQTCDDYTLQSHFVSRATLIDTTAETASGVRFVSVRTVGSFVFATGAPIRYVGDPYFQVFDFSDIRSPTPAGSIERFPAINGVDLQVSGDFAYVVASNRLFIAIDIGDPENPVEVGALTMPTSASAVALVGSTAFVATFDSGLVAIDVSNPASPSWIGGLLLAGRTSKVVCDATYAYVGLRDIQDEIKIVNVVDISNPANMALLGAVSAPCVGIEVSGSYLYTGGMGGLRVIDVSNPAAPAVVGSFTASNVGGLDAEGGMVYAAYGSVSPYNSAGNPLAVFDVSNPVNPVLAMTTNVGVHGASDAVCAEEGYVYAAHSSADDFGIEVLEVKQSAPTNQTSFADLAGNGELWAFRVAGTRAFAGTSIGGVTPYELRLFDLTTPSAPVVLGSAQYSTTGGSIVAIDGDASRAFVLRQTQLLAVDITSPPVLPTVGSLDLASTFSSVGDMRLDGSHLYTLDNSPPALRVFDVSSPSNMVEVGDVAFSAQLSELIVRDDYAYVAWGQGTVGGPSGLEIVDVSNPTNPTRVSTVPLYWNGLHVALDGDVAFVAYRNISSRLSVVDVSNSLAPVVIDDIGLPLSVAGLAVLGSFLYAGTNGGVVAVLDVSNPTDVRHVGSFHPGTSWHGRHIEISGGFLVMSCAYSYPGVHVLCNSPFAGVYAPQCDPASAIHPTSTRSAMRMTSYPNPFNPAVVVRISLPDRQDIRVSVIDVSGRVVAELLNGRLEQGSHELRWDGRDQRGTPAASGVYFVRAISGSDVETVKVTLLK